MKPSLDMVGIGIGPFNLSLAALLSKVPEVRTQFFEQKKTFNWHSEIMFNDSVMQTSYLKDLVTPVDPTNPHSFLNYLVQHGLFYAHLNTGRGHVGRREFEMYCQWVCKNLGDQLKFDAPVEEVDFKDGLFHITAKGERFTAKNICVGTGMTTWIPEFAKASMSATCVHAKSPQLASLNATGKRIAIVGGGQTGLEIFRNAFQGRWGEAASVSLISRRHTLEPLDESPFTNEYFTPSYVRDFYQIDPMSKPDIVRHQRFASDGNTPSYLQDMYNELYRIKHVEGKGDGIHILSQRHVVNMETTETGHQLFVANFFTGKTEHIEADVVILCTGFKNTIPACLKPLTDKINFDKEGRFQINAQFALDWKEAPTNKIYALNFGRHIHGIAEPQTSLMAWRSGTIVNDLMGKEVYAMKAVENFVQHGKY